MLYDFSKPILDTKDEIINDLKKNPSFDKSKPVGVGNQPMIEDPDKPMTMKDRIVDSLLGSCEEDKGMSGKDTDEIYDLYKKIKRNKPVELCSEEKILIKKRVQLLQSRLVYGQIRDYLEDIKEDTAEDAPEDSEG